MMPLQELVTEVDRVRYSEGQYLGAADLQADQDYHRQALGRHELGGHTWGIVTGFELTEVPDPADSQFVDPVLTPGLAIDGYGRQIVSFTGVQVDAGLFDAFTNDGHRSVWVRYDETTARPPADGFADCSDGEATRTVETFTLVVDPPVTTSEVWVDGTPASPPPAQPNTPEIPADTSVPYQELPVEPPVRHWLVRLGSLHWDGTVGRFRPAAAGRLGEQRVYAGAVAAAVLSPSDALRIAPRAAATDMDAAEFATVEGRLRVRGRISAEKDVWLEGSALRFAYTGAAEENTPIVLGRDHGSGAEQRLRLRLGDDAKATTYLSIGTKAGVGETTVAEIHADGLLSIPTGLLDFGTVTRQEINLSGPDSGIGTQPGDVYFRSKGSFDWYHGGKHSDTDDDPGSGGALCMKLDDAANLDVFGNGGVHGNLVVGKGANGFVLTRHVNGKQVGNDGLDSLYLNWNTGHSVVVGVAGNPSDLEVNGNASTTGFLTVGRGGDSHVLTRHVLGKQSGADGIDNLYLNWNTGRDVVVGSPGNPSALQVTGALSVQGTGSAAVASVFKIRTYNLVVQNSGSSPNTWNQGYSGEFDEVLAAYTVMTGFSINNQLFNPNPDRFQDLQTIPQHVWLTVDAFSTSGANGRGFCAQSDASLDYNNTIAFTLVVIGRKWT